MTIVYFSLLAFALLGIIGYFFNRSKAWSYIDVIYYPLGAVGVVLLFLHQSSERQVLDLLGQYEQKQTALRMLQEEKPNVDRLLQEDKFLRVSGSLLETIPELGEACKGSGSVAPNCMTARELGPIVSKYLNAFSKPQNDEAIVRVCQASELLLNEVKEEWALSPFIAEELIDHYRKGLRKGFYELQYDAVSSYVDSFEAAAKPEAEKIARVVANSEAEEKSLLARYSTDIRFGLTILRSFSICLRAPEPLRNGKFLEWSNAYTEANADSSKTESEIQELSKKEMKRSDLVLFSFFWWPYIIISALALKFGRGVSGVRNH